MLSRTTVSIDLWVDRLGRQARPIRWSQPVVTARVAVADAVTVRVAVHRHLTSESEQWQIK
jgi:hypothetical protein